jgi:NAD(P)-dependent dehydrogenase (short-subunit alcohol dehydrogenase family)
LNQAQKTVLVVGGSSDIGRAIALRYAEQGWQVALSARSVAAGERNAADIAARTGTRVAVHRLDVFETEAFPAFIDGLAGLPDTIVCVVGELGDQRRAETDIAYAAQIMRANYEGPALLIGLFAERFQSRGSGTIVGVSSVAGERGRGSNYVYGSAKAGLTAFLSGLRNRLSRTGIHVLTVKPGYVRTRMTADLQLPAVLTADPRQVGDAIYRAAEVTKRDVIFVLPIWRFVMLVVCSVPERIFKNLRL